MTGAIRTATILFAALAATCSFVTSVRTEARPNFLFIVGDDFGWRDRSYNGTGFYETARIEGLAA